jgi:serine phosphatase RsbU (regulator of sigma subunit)
MGLHFDIAHVQLNKHGEELCGDSIRRLEAPDGVIVAMSDGLGSGVKANILSSLTVTIASRMLEKGLSLEAVVEALSETLPMCRVRKLAYSTFTFLQLSRDGRAHLAEYDNPPAFIGRDGHLVEVERHEREIHERTVNEADFAVEDGSWIALVSDGVPNAGIGGVWNLGWGWERVGAYIEKLAGSGLDSADLAREMAALVDRLYAGKPGDDATVVVVRVRKPRLLTALIGPPRSRQDDPVVPHELLEGAGG